jgi:hypothetical protein
LYIYLVVLELKDYVSRNSSIRKYNDLRTSLLYEQWNSYLDEIMNTQQDAILTCDFNFHVDDKRGSDAVKFLQTLDDRNLRHVSTPTHKHGHILDLLIAHQIQP